MKPALIAGVGNIFHGDDAFGVHVARRLAEAPVPAGCDVIDFGIRGLDLAYALTGGYRFAVLVDTVQRGEPPGTLYVIEPEAAPDGSGSGSGIDGSEDSGRFDLSAPISPHEIDPASVLRLARAIGGDCAEVLLVGCEPATFGDLDEGRMGLSDAVEAAVGEAAALAASLVADWLRDNEPAQAGNESARAEAESATADAT